MAILGLFTTLGISKTIDAQNNEGFKIFPTSFGVSRDIGALSPSRTGANSGQWYTAAISSRTVVDQNTIKIVCTVPPGSFGVTENIKEVYVYAKDSSNNDFLLALGQPSEQIIYDPTGTITLELQISLADVDLTSIYVFNNTKAQEIEEHELDPNAHPDIIKALADHGIYIPAGAYPEFRKGQNIEFPVNFEGSKSAFTYSGVTFTATYNGTELNGLNVVFNGTKTNDEIRADFNAIHYPNTIEHNGSGAGVLAASTKVLTGGAYLVDELDLVYKDTDGVYKKALADGTNKSRVAGFALRAIKTLVGPGFADIDTGFDINTPLYLSGDDAGKITDFNTNISIGLSLGDHIYFTGFPGDISTSVSQEFDAVVTDASGVGQFSSTQEAINAVPNDGKILISKLELVKETIDTMGKSLNFVFNGSETGWKRFLGTATVFKVSFSAVPTQGTFRIEWNGQETNDIAWNANAATVQTEFNQLNGHNGFTVTGNNTIGFTFTSSDSQVYALPTFVYAGNNEIQRFTFSDVPDNGTVKFRFKSQDTVNYAYNDSLAQLQTALDNLSSTNQLTVTGSFATGFTIEFTGGYLLDGNQEQPLIQAVTNFLFKNSNPVSINGTVSPPINSTVIQKGKTAAANLYNGSTILSVDVESITEGEDVGPDRLMEVDSPVLNITGMGLIEDFREGLVLTMDNTILHLQARAVGTDKPVMSLGKLPSIDYDIEMPGYAKDFSCQLKLSEHPINKKRALVSGMDFQLPSGITLSKELRNLKAKFLGAEVDFTLGKIYASDGVTSIGPDFVPPVITPTYWRWYSVNLRFSSVDGVTNEAKCDVSVIPGPSEGTTKSLAGRPLTDAIPVGLVAIRGALGLKEKTVITTIKDSFLTPLKGKTLILYHPTESVAFWFSDPALMGGKPTLALTATRDVEITTLVANDYQATVAAKLQAAIDADAKFIATVVGNQVTVENTVLGSVVDANMGTTGFFKKVIVQGTATDPTGIDDVKNDNIVQFSLGSGGSNGAETQTLMFSENIGFGNAIRVAYTLSKAPLNVQSVFVFIDGGYIEPSNYSIAGSVITFNTAPAVGLSVYAQYTLTNQTTLAGIQETLTGGANGINTVFNMSGFPVNKEMTMVFINGGIIDKNEYSLLMGPLFTQVIFNTAPAIGVTVSAAYFTPIGTLPTSSGGGIATASNIGPAGIGIYHSLIGSNLNFKKILVQNGTIVDNGDGTVTITPSLKPKVYGLVASPITFDPTLGLTPGPEDNQIFIIKTSGGNQSVSALVQIAAGSFVGQRISLRGTNSTDTYTFRGNALANLDGLSLNGDCTISNNQSLQLCYDGIVWYEESRRG